VVEVLVAGAGPAGAAAAIVLARAGVRVLLVDRARFPRPKLCGDSLNPGALDVLAALGLRADVEARGLRLAGMRVTSREGDVITGVYRTHHALALTRDVLDAMLLEAAARAGAQVETGVRVVGALVDSAQGRPTVKGAILVTPRGRMRLPAGWTVAADGRRSSLALPLGLAAQPAHPRRWAVGAYFTGVEGLAEFGEMHVRHGYYLGVAPLPGGLANACLVTDDRRRLAQPLEALERAVITDPLLAPRFAAATRVSRVACAGPLAVDARTSGMDGLLLAGDAAGFVDPMTGDGLRFALRGGVLAAEAILRACDRTAVLPHRWLAARRRREFGAKQRFNRVLRRLVASDLGLALGERGARISPALLRLLIVRAGDVPRTHGWTG
jgi:flavin-dependent dehydrogenase